MYTSRSDFKEVMKILINLTPHAIHETTTGRTFVPSGNVARVSVSYEEAGTLDGIPLFKATYGSIEGLPDESQDTIYIVSGLVASAVKRADVVSPGDLVRDEAGKPVGCKGFKVSI